MADEAPLVTAHDYRMKARSLRMQAASGGVSQLTADGTTVRFVPPSELLEMADKLDQIAKTMNQRPGHGLGYSKLRYRRGR